MTTKMFSGLLDRSRIVRGSHSGLRCIICILVIPYVITGQFPLYRTDSNQYLQQTFLGLYKLVVFNQDESSHMS